MGPKGPRADTRNLGKYLPMTRETHPDSFYGTREEQAAAQSASDEVIARLRADLRREHPRDFRRVDRGEAVVDDDEDEDEQLSVPEVASDDLGDSDYAPERKPKKQKLSSGPKSKSEVRAVEDPEESDDDMVSARPKRSAAPKSRSKGPVAEDPDNSDDDVAPARSTRSSVPKPRSKMTAVDDPEDSDSEPVAKRPARLSATKPKSKEQAVDSSEESDFEPDRKTSKRSSAPKSKGKGRAADSPEESEDGAKPPKTRQSSQRLPGSRIKSTRRAIDSSDEEPEEEDPAAGEEAEQGEEAEGAESDAAEDEEGEDEEDEEVEVPADALGVDDGGWKYGNPKSKPLTYFVHADAAGGVKAKTIKYDVDFTSRESVNKANKTRRLELIRAKKRHGFTDLKRPSTKGREYSDENDDWISIIHEDYAIANNGTRIPPAELTERYNERFPLEDRAESSISSHIRRLEHLKDMRNSYPLGRD